MNTKVMRHNYTTRWCGGSWGEEGAWGGEEGRRGAEGDPSVSRSEEEEEEEEEGGILPCCQEALLLLPFPLFIPSSPVNYF